MPSPLERYKKDPNNLGRGEGIYYYRGPYTTAKGQFIRNYYSKYSVERDSKIKAKGFKKHKIGLPVKNKYRHTYDGYK